SPSMIILCKKLKKVQFQSNLFPQLIIYNIRDYIDGEKYFPVEGHPSFNRRYLTVPVCLLEIQVLHWLTNSYSHFQNN
ncbi:MAG: hypothetical protein KAX05_12185, partial [Bacteroidales bacterium]|nr:hypothetical protein [Bacteroidales bacterium]